MTLDIPLHVIPQSEVHYLQSSSVDQEYRISVALPRGYGSGENDYPVLYALDADAGFGTIVEGQRMMSIRQELSDILIVGIGYPVDDFTKTINVRRRDLTPTIDQVELEALLDGGMKETSTTVMGGGPDFHNFIQQELMPYIEQRYSVDVLDRGIAGVSFGGLFAAYCLFHHTDTFRRYIICSPSLLWDEDVIFEYERNYSAKSHELEASVFISVGGLESEDGIRAVKRLGTILEDRQYKGLQFTMEIFAEETHLSVGAAALWRGLREIYGQS